MAITLELSRLQRSLIRQAKEVLGDDVGSSHREQGQRLSSEELLNLALNQA